MSGDIVSLLIQAGGAVAVCGMFLWFLRGQRKADQDRINAQQKADQARDSKFFDQLDKQTSYLRERDAQSKEIALNGHAALREVGTQLQMLREQLLANGS